MCLLSSVLAAIVRLALYFCIKSLKGVFVFLNFYFTLFQNELEGKLTSTWLANE